MNEHEELELLKKHALEGIETMALAASVIAAMRERLNELQGQNQEQSQRIADLERLLAEARNVSAQA